MTRGSGVAARTETHFPIAEFNTMFRTQGHDLAFMTVGTFHVIPPDSATWAVPLVSRFTATEPSEQTFGSPGFHSEYVAPFSKENDSTLRPHSPHPMNLWTRDLSTG